MALFVKKEETNWNRACRLLTNAGKELLMLYLHDFWSRNGNWSLDHFLYANQSTLATNRHIDATQLNVLYPASGSTDTNIWDITLVSCVISSCIPNKTRLETAALNRIRNLRNRMYHAGRMEMDGNEFTKNWADIQQTLTGAARDLSMSQHFSLQDIVDRIEKEQVVDGEELRNTMQAWKSCDIALTEGIQQLGEGQKEIEKGQKELVKGQNELGKGQKELGEGQKELGKGQKELGERQKELETRMSVIQHRLKESACHSEINAGERQEELRTRMSEIEHKLGESKCHSKTILSEVRGIKTMMTETKLKDSGKDPSPSGERVPRCPGNMVGPAVQHVPEECTGSDTGAEAETTLPEEFRVLQSGLIDHYKAVLTLPTGVGNLSGQVDMDEIYAEPCLVHVDHTAGTREKAKETERNISLKDIFNTRGCRQIYVSADAGNGKTSLCKRIIKDWCSVHSQDHHTDDPGQTSTLKQFHFLFYIPLRNAFELYDINEMIVSQLLYKNPHIKQAKCTNNKADDLLDEVLEQYSERCLVVLDGLDEWTAPRRSRYPSVSNGVPGRNPHLDYTMLTTTRPWKLESLRLRSTEIDRQIEIRGVKYVDEFGIKLVNAHNKEDNKQKDYIDFEVKLKQTGLQKMKETPIMLKQLITLWHNDQAFGNSYTEVYTNMVGMLFQLAEKREDITEFNLHTGQSEMEAVATPVCLKNVERCERYKCLLLSIGKLAFETLFCANKETQLVFESSEAKKNCLHKSDIDLCLTVGILTQSIIPDKTCERKSLSFVHKTFHEYCAALYLSVFGNGLDDLKTRIGSKCKSLDELFDMEDLFLFVSGMSPSLMKDMFPCLLTSINDATTMAISIPSTYDNSMHSSCEDQLLRVQSIILACCRESSIVVLYCEIVYIDAMWWRR